MAVYEIKQQQFINRPLHEVWDFFSNPKNLAVITPDYMNFTVTSAQTDAIYAGQIITYKVSPILGIPLYWMTEITQVKEGKSFIDEQKIGPYKLWHHQHFFEEKDGGVLMKDHVHYQLPLGFLGNIVHFLFVKSQLENIFKYRKNKVEELLG
jgi:ligand-binding SRPBCC domain-containing protein